MGTYGSNVSTIHTMSTIHTSNTMSNVLAMYTMYYV